MIQNIFFVAIAVHFVLALLQGTIFNGVIAESVVSADTLDLIILNLFLIIIFVGSTSRFGNGIRAQTTHWLSAFILYAAIVICSSAVQTEPLKLSQWVDILLGPVTILALCGYCPLVLSELRFWWLVGGILFLFSISAFLSAWVFVTDAHSFFGIPFVILEDARGGRWGRAGLSFFLHRNTIGAYLAPLPALAFALGLRFPSLRVTSLGVVGVLVLHLLATYSRSSWVACAVSLIPLIQEVTGKRFRLVMTLTTTVGLILSYLTNNLWLSGREGYWIELFKRIFEKPFFGFGLFNIKLLQDPYHPEGYTPHNVFLAQLGYFGIIGLAAFLSMLYGIWCSFYHWITSRNRPLAERLVAWSVVGLLVQGLTEYTITFPVFFSNSLFWIFTGFILNQKIKGDKSE